MGHSDVNLHWRPESIADIMRDNGIRTRGQLASRLDPRGIGKVTVYRSFNEEWSGVATCTLITAIAKEFGASLAQLVTEPKEYA